MDKENVQCDLRITGENIGEASGRLAKESFQTFLYFDKDEQFTEKAEMLARHDLTCNRIIAEFALKELDKMIKEHKSKMHKNCVELTKEVV